MVSAQLASDVDGDLSPFAEPGLFEFSLILRPGVSGAAALAALQAELTRLPDDLQAAELEKARCNLELAILEELQDVEGCAAALGHHETNEGDFSRALTQLARYAKVELGDLSRVAAATFLLARRSAVLAHAAGEASL